MEDQLKKRFDTWYKAGNSGSIFYLQDYLPNLEECRFILLKVIEQAKRDLINYADATTPVKKEIWEEARQFLFDDDYTIMWGDQEMSLRDIGHLLGLEVVWMREKLAKQIAKAASRRKKYAEEEGTGEKHKRASRARSGVKQAKRYQAKGRKRSDSEYRKSFRQGFNLKT